MTAMMNHETCNAPFHTERSGPGFCNLRKGHVGRHREVPRMTREERDARRAVTLKDRTAYQHSANGTADPDSAK